MGDHGPAAKADECGRRRGRAHLELELRAELVWEDGAVLAEGPCWDLERGVLWWVDIVSHKVHALDPRMRMDRSWDVGGYVGAVVPRRAGGLVVALQDGLYALDPDTGERTPLARVEHGPQVRFNDGKCDPAGRFWAGTMSTNEQPAMGALYALEADRTVRRVIAPVTVSNGLGWSPDRGTMYYIDSPTRQVLAYPYDIAQGALGEPRVAAAIPAGEGVPDGMTVDAEGMIWVAQWGGWKVSRFDPRTGERLATVAVPAARASSCAFGGAERDVLYITTACAGMSADERESQPLAGGVFCVRPGVRGLPTDAYAG